MNQINVIHPYLWQGQWVFDDPDVGLMKEAFVAGADDVCDRLLAMVGRPSDTQFTLRFSKDKFPRTQFSFAHVGEGEGGGHYYYCGALKITGWLCPALFKYFDKAPEQIHIQAKRQEVHDEKLAI